MVKVFGCRERRGRALAAPPPGDALIEVHVAPHEVFRRDGDDVKIELPVASPRRCSGEMTVPTVTGRWRYDPKGSDTGAQLRLAAKESNAPKPWGSICHPEVVIGPER